MSILDTVLIFVAAPLAVVAAVFGLVYAGSARNARRYRPGRPFEYLPVWFLSAPERMVDGDGRRELAAGGERRAPVEGADESAWPGEDPTVPQGVTGGASDRW